MDEKTRFAQFAKESSVFDRLSPSGRVLLNEISEKQLKVKLDEETRYTECALALCLKLEEAEQKLAQALGIINKIDQEVLTGEQRALIYNACEDLSQCLRRIR